MNWVDGVVAIVVILFALNGYRKGFIRQFADFVGLAISVVVSFAFYGKLAIYMANQFSSIPMFLNKVLALSILWIGTQLVFYLIFGLLYHYLPEGIRKSKVNRIFGTVPGLAWGALFTLIIVSLLSVLLGLTPSAKNTQIAISDSYTGKFISSQSGRINGYFSKLFGSSINDTFTFKTVPVYGGETVDLGFKTTNVSVDQVSEDKMLELVNVERIKRGLKPLVMDEKLQEVARAHSRDMFARGYFAHNTPEGKDPFQRMDEAGIKYLLAGENLALAPTVEMAHEGLMNSPGHRANILTAEFGKVGIGCIDGGKYGKMFSQEFTN